MRSLTALLAALMICIAPIAANAQQQQTAKTESPPSILSQLFPKVTGMNGYEELVMAADLVRNNKALEKAQQDGATLAIMRYCLADKDVRQALVLLHDGLDKPVFSPRDQNTVDENTLLPEMGPLRNLARILKIRQYVSLADGNISAAIDSLWEGLRLGYIIQQESLISGLVGVAIDSVVLNGVAEHYDQLSVADCTRLIQIAQEWLKTPSPLRHVVENEHKFSLRYLSSFRNNSERLLKQIDLTEDTAGGASGEPAAVELARYVNDHPTEVNTLVDQATTLANAEFEATITNLNLPFWQRKPVVHNSRASMPARLVSVFTADYDRVLERYDTERAKIHLLAVHAAIHRFRWENNRLPRTIGELQMNELTQDPYTGKPLVYTLHGDTYELYSAGPQGSSSGPSGPIYLPNKRN